MQREKVKCTVRIVGHYCLMKPGVVRHVELIVSYDINNEINSEQISISEIKTDLRTRVK